MIGLEGVAIMVTEKIVPLIVVLMVAYEERTRTEKKSVEQLKSPLTTALMW